MLLVIQNCVENVIKIMMKHIESKKGLYQGFILSFLFSPDQEDSVI